MSLRDVINKLKGTVQFNVEQAVLQIIDENTEFLIFLLKYQMSQGIDGDGKMTTVFGKDFYADSTVFEKERHGVGLGRETNFITNYMSGEFYESIQMTRSGSTVVFTSDVPYYEEILLRSGKNIMKFNIETTKIFEKEILNPQLKIKYEAFVNGIR